MWLAHPWASTREAILMQAGISRIDITPPTGLAMAGYLARTGPAEDVHDPLYARALVLDDGEQRVAFGAADLAAIEPGLAAAIRKRIEHETGIPPSHTMILLSHTHSGPLVASRRVADVDVSYIESFQNNIVGAVREANEALRPVRVGFGQGKVYLGINRRERTADNNVVIGKNPKGYASPYTNILLAAQEHGGPLAILFTCGAHPVVLGPDNLKISGDYAGFAERVVEENFGGNAIALFALGFAGNVNPNYQKRTFQEVDTIGTALGRAVLEQMKSIELVSDLCLQARSIRVALPLEPPPPAAEADRILFDERERLSAVLGRGEDKGEINRRRMMVEWATELVQLARDDQGEHSAELEIQVIAVGNTAFVGLSAEVFAEYEKSLAEVSNFEHTFPVSNANGNIGYIPTAAAFDEGGYEVEMAARLFGALRFTPEVEAVVCEAAAGLLAEMAGTPAPAAGSRIQ
jgi:hypothetical protein